VTGAKWQPSTGGTDSLVAKLPEDMRRGCEAVIQYSVPKAAEKLNMPQSTLRDKLKGLRLYFAELQGYLNTRV